MLLNTSTRFKDNNDNFFSIFCDSDLGLSWSRQLWAPFLWYHVTINFNNLQITHGQYCYWCALKKMAWGMYWAGCIWTLHTDAIFLPRWGSLMFVVSHKVSNGPSAPRFTLFLAGCCLWQRITVDVLIMYQCVHKNELIHIACTSVTNQTIVEGPWFRFHYDNERKDK